MGIQFEHDFREGFFVSLWCSYRESNCV